MKFLKTIKRFTYTQSFFSFLTLAMVVALIFCVSFFLGFLVREISQLGERGVPSVRPENAGFDIDGFKRLDL